MVKDTCLLQHMIFLTSPSAFIVLSFVVGLWNVAPDPICESDLEHIIYSICEEIVLWEEKQANNREYLWTTSFPLMSSFRHVESKVKESLS